MYFYRPPKLSTNYFRNYVGIVFNKVLLFFKHSKVTTVPDKVVISVYIYMSQGLQLVALLKTILSIVGLCKILQNLFPKYELFFLAMPYNLRSLLFRVLIWEIPINRLNCQTHATFCKHVCIMEPRFGGIINCTNMRVHLFCPCPNFPFSVAVIGK